MDIIKEEIEDVITEEETNKPDVVEEVISEEIVVDEEMINEEMNKELEESLTKSIDDIQNIAKAKDEEEEIESEKPIEKSTKPLIPVNDSNTVSDKDKEDAKQLYDEFSSFLETRADIKSDEGIKLVIPTGIDILDAHLGGGIVVGGMGIIVGSPGSGKTMLAIQTLANGQKVFKGDMIGSFLDAEEATTTIRLSNLGVNYPKIKPYTDVTVEKVFKFLEGLCLFKEEKGIIDKPSIIIWDSIANTLSQKEREVEDINSVIGYKARLLSLLIPKYVAKCAKYGICLLAINQLRDNLQLGQFTAPSELKFMTHTKVMPGGNALRFNAIQLLEMKVKQAITVEKSPYGFNGIAATVKVVKNKLFAPNITIDICGTFVHGFSNFWTSYMFLVNTKRLKSGAWNYLITHPDKKFRTKDAENMYKTDPEFKNNFDALVTEAIKTDVIEKYDGTI